jgi:hypothetical protein
MVKVTFLNNDGGGYAKVLELDEGTTVQQVFVKEMGESAKPENYLIRVNRQPVASDATLADGDRLSCTPTKIDGAVR